jgi:hypothetical protein
MPELMWFEETVEELLAAHCDNLCVYPTRSLWAGYGENSDEMHAIAAKLHSPKEDTGPALLVVPANYGGPVYSGIEPQYVQFNADAGNVVTSIRWSS